MHRRGALPVTAWAAIWLGMQGRCPRCGAARLFAKFLKPVAACPACGQNWTLHSADDFPAYLSILVTGHIMAPIIIALVSDSALPLWAITIIILTLAVGLLIGLLQPAKGGVIAAQWWFGLSGFAPPPDPPNP